jgi:hypothetical protein
VKLCIATPDETASRSLTIFCVGQCAASRLKQK